MLKGIASRLGRRDDEPHARWTWKWPLAVSSLIAAAALLFAIGAWSRRGPERSPVSFFVHPPSGTTLGLTESTVKSAQLAISPDGRLLAFVAAESNGKHQLWVQPLDRVEARRLAEHRRRNLPVLVSGWPLHRVLRGQAAEANSVERRACRDPRRRPQRPRRHVDEGQRDRVCAEHQRLTASCPRAPRRRSRNAAHDEGDDHDSHRWPQILPDGRQVLFFVQSSNPETEGIYITSIDNPSQAKRLRQASTNGLYAAGHLLYVADGVLLNIHSTRRRRRCPATALRSV